MERQESASDTFHEDSEFEGRFTSSFPNADNLFWWHHDQSSLEQQLPNCIPIPNDIGASRQSVVGQSRWNTERLNVDQLSSRSSGDHSQRMEVIKAISGVGSGSINSSYQSIVGTYQGDSNGSSIDVSNSNFNQTLVMESMVNEFITKDFLTHVVSSGHPSSNQTGISSSSARASMNFLRNGIILREENNRPALVVVTICSSDKRKSPEGYRDESSAMASKRCGGSNAAPSSHIPRDVGMKSSSVNIYGVDSLGTSSSGTVPPRNSFFEIPYQRGKTRSDQDIGQSSSMRTNTSEQGLVPRDFLSPETSISQNSDWLVQHPSLVTPTSQAVVEGSNVPNQPMTAQSPLALQQGVHLVVHHNGSINIDRNSSRPDFAQGNAQTDQMGSGNSTQRLRLPVISPSVGPSNFRKNFGTSGGDASIDVNTNLGAPSDPNPNPNPNLPVPTSNLISNSYRRRRLELIRQALLEVDSFSEDSTISHPGHGVHLGMTPETMQRLISRARHIITMYRGGRDISLLEDGVNARRSLVSALASIHDQHRDMRLDVDNMSYEELLELGERIGNVKTGLSEEKIIDSLNCTKYTFNEKSNQIHPEPCSICREEYSEGEDMGTLDCGHEYHTYCIKQWLVLKNSCPICKAAAASSSAK